MNKPFSGLSPDVILDSLQSLGLFPDGRLLALNSYENRVYQAGMEESPPVVVKYYRNERWTDEAIVEEHRFVQTLYESEIPVVPPIILSGRTLHAFGEFRFAVFERKGGRAPELEREDILEWMGRFLGRIHAIGGLEAYRHRPSINLETFGIEPGNYLISHDFIPRDLLEAYGTTLNFALDGVKRAFERAGDCRPIRLHGDCHAGNVLWTEEGPHFVDFDDSRMGPAIQDIWLLLSGERPEMTRQIVSLLSGYEDFCDFDSRELHLVEALRTLRLIHYSAWIARRWEDPAFPIAFPWFGTERYWQDRILELKEQISLMEEPPLLHT
ncbi:MAG TPA: serine/threonine protein kinase [Burkholderiales bacterium]|nr:serine/threonine protein kinase [Burkholderiales bacterium]